MLGSMEDFLTGPPNPVYRFYTGCPLLEQPDEEPMPSDERVYPAQPLDLPLGVLQVGLTPHSLITKGGDFEIDIFGEMYGEFPAEMPPYTELSQAIPPMEYKTAIEALNAELFPMNKKIAEQWTKKAYWMACIFCVGILTCGIGLLLMLPCLLMVLCPGCSDHHDVDQAVVKLNAALASTNQNCVKSNTKFEVVKYEVKKTVERSRGNNRGNRGGGAFIWQHWDTVALRITMPVSQV
jgi:hypothetical protein